MSVADSLLPQPRLYCCRAVKSMIGETYDSKAQARALGYLSLSWGTGTVVGKHVADI